MTDQEFFAALFGSIMGGVGLLFLLLGLVLAAARRRKKKRCIRETAGTVVDMHEYHDDGVRRCPVVQYYAGGTYHKAVLQGCPPGGLEIGQQITVFYDPEKPYSFYITGMHPLQLISTIFILVGALLMAVAAIVVWYVLTHSVTVHVYR